MNVLVTGGAGYLGCVLVGRMLAAEYLDVTVVDTFEHRRRGIVAMMDNKRLHVRTQDAFETDISTFDYIVNLAAIAGEAACLASKKDVFATNYLLPLRLAKDLRDDQFMIQASTTAIFGDAKGRYIDDEQPAPANKLGMYASSKMLVEEELGQRPNLAVVRIPTLYGMSPALRPGLLIHDLCDQAVRGQVTLYGNILARRPVGHVDSVATVLFDIMRKAVAGTHMLAAENLTKAEIASRIAIAANVEAVKVDGTDLAVQDHAVRQITLRKLLRPSLPRILAAHRLLL